jgi:hypothetical protein
MVNLLISFEYLQTLFFPRAQKSKANSCLPVNTDQRKSSLSISISLEFKHMGAKHKTNSNFFYQNQFSARNPLWPLYPGTDIFD